MSKKSTLYEKGDLIANRLAKVGTGEEKRGPSPFDELMGVPSDTMIENFPLGSIIARKDQPRQVFDDVQLTALAKSIKSQGILQPLLVRQKGDKYEIVVGERRFRAAFKAGLDTVPAVVCTLSDEEAQEAALTENLTREDLNPVDETIGIMNLIGLRLHLEAKDVKALLHRMKNEDDGKVTQNVLRSEDEVVKAIFTKFNKTTWQSFVTSRLPILKYPEDVLAAVQQGRLHYTKAQDIVKVLDETTRAKILNMAVDQNLSVAKVRELVRKYLVPRQPLSANQVLVENIKRRLTPQRINNFEGERRQEIEALLKRLQDLLTH
jgi:ParB family chromosome partitioning protein